MGHANCSGPQASPLRGWWGGVRYLWAETVNQACSTSLTCQVEMAPPPGPAASGLSLRSGSCTCAGHFTPTPPTPRCLKRSCLRRESFRPRDSPEPACLLRRRRTEPRQRAQGSCGLGLLSSCAELKGAVFLRLRGQISNCSHNSDEYSP